MKRWIFAALLSCVLMAPASAQDVRLDAPATFARDSKVLFTIAGLEAQTARTKWWVRSNDGRLPPDHEVFHDGLTCAVWGKPGKYEVLVTVAVLNETDIAWHDIEHEFTISGQDDPTPPPPPPPSKYDFGDVTAKVVELAAPVKDTNKAEAARLIATSYRKHGLLAEQGEYADPNALADATASEFTADLGLNRYLKWRPMMTRLREHMSELMQAGKLKNDDMAAWGALWKQYADGFDAVADKGASDGASR